MPTIDFTALEAQTNPSAADLGLTTLGGGDGIGGGGSVTANGYIAADPDGVNCLEFRGDEIIDASLLLVANGEFSTYLDTDGKWARAWFEVRIDLSDDDGISTQRSEVIYGANPDFRILYGEPGATGDSGNDYSNEGKHFQINGVSTAGSSGEVVPGDGSAKRTRIPFGRRFRMEMQIGRISSTNYTLVLLIDGKPIKVREVVTSAAGPGNRMNNLKWEDIGDGSTTEYYRMRLYKAGYEVAASGGFTGNYTGTADSTLTRSSDAAGKARVFSTPLGDADYSSCWDLSNLASVASSDYGQAHDAWVATRGFNAYPMRWNFTQASDNGSIRTRESDLAFPIVDNRAGVLWLFQPSDSATDSAGARLVCRDGGGATNADIEFSVGFASTSDGESELQIQYGTSGGAINTQSTGITILTDKPWVITVSVDADAYLGVTAQRLDLANSTAQQVFYKVSNGVMGVPEDGFQFWVEFESANCGGNPGTFTMLDMLMLPRIPVTLESSYQAEQITSGTGDDNSDYSRAANVAQAGGELMGAGAVISEVEALGLFPEPYRAPGLILGRSGMNMQEWVENFIGGNPDGFFAAARAICPIVVDGRVNGMVQTGTPATDSAVNIQHILEMMDAAIGQSVRGVFPIRTIPPAIYDSYTEAVRNTHIAHDSTLAGLELQGRFQGWKVVDMVAAYADVDTGTLALFPTSDGTIANGTDFHPNKDFEWVDVMYGAQLRDAVAGTRRRDRSRDR